MSAIRTDDLAATMGAMTRFAGHRPALALEPLSIDHASAAFWNHTPKTSRLAGHRLHILALTVRGAAQVDQIVAGRSVWRGPISTSVALLRQDEASEWHMGGPFEQLQLYLDLSEFPNVQHIAHLDHPFRDDMLIDMAKCVATAVREGCTSRRFLSPVLEALKEAFIARHLAGAAAGYGARARGGLSGAVGRRLDDFIHARLATRITIEELADCAQLSVGHFNRAFRDTHGMSPHKYLTDRRMAHAATLLCETDLPISDVAAQTGFASGSHFGAVFRRQTGHTPLYFRRAHRAPGNGTPQ